MEIYMLQDSTDGAILCMTKDKEECIEMLKECYNEDPYFYVYDSIINNFERKDGCEYFGLEMK